MTDPGNGETEKGRRALVESLIILLFPSRDPRHGRPASRAALDPRVAIPETDLDRDLLDAGDGQRDRGGSCPTPLTSLVVLLVEEARPRPARSRPPAARSRTPPARSQGRLARPERRARENPATVFERAQRSPRTTAAALATDRPPRGTFEWEWETAAPERESRESLVHVSVFSGLSRNRALALRRR